MAEDVKDMQRRLKEMELRAKMESKMEKKKLKDEKMKMKLQKRQEKMRRKLEKSGKMSPEDIKRLEGGLKEKEAVGTKEKIVKAEVVEFKPKEWKRRSVQSLDDVEKKIDRLSGKGVTSLSDRYREKYGEDLKVPELYQIETSLEMDSDIERLSLEDEGDLDDEGFREMGTSTSSDFQRKKAEAEISLGEPKEKPELSFMDLSSGVLYLRDKYGAKGGGGKRAVLVILDIVVLVVLFPLTIIRIFTTIYYSRKRKKVAKAENQSQDAVQVAEA